MRENILFSLLNLLEFWLKLSVECTLSPSLRHSWASEGAFGALPLTPSIPPVGIRSLCQKQLPRLVSSVTKSRDQPKEEAPKAGHPPRRVPPSDGCIPGQV